MAGFSRSDCSWRAGAATGGFQAEDWRSQALLFTQGTGQNHGFPALPFPDGCSHRAWQLRTLLAGAENPANGLNAFSPPMSNPPSVLLALTSKCVKDLTTSHHPHGFFGPSPRISPFYAEIPSCAPLLSLSTQQLAQMRSVLCSEPSVGCTGPSVRHRKALCDPRGPRPGFPAPLQPLALPPASQSCSCPRARASVIPSAWLTLWVMASLPVVFAQVLPPQVHLL